MPSFKAGLFVVFILFFELLVYVGKEGLVVTPFVDVSFRRLHFDVYGSPGGVKDDKFGEVLFV